MMAVTIKHVAEVLRTFTLAPISASSLQPVLDLAGELNPDLALAVVCGWCQLTMTAGRYPASHGICSTCQRRAFEER